MTFDDVLARAPEPPAGKVRLIPVRDDKDYALVRGALAQEGYRFMRNEGDYDRFSNFPIDICVMCP